jgi:hypothetical protein
MTVTTGDEEPARGVSGEPLDMRRGSNYDPPAQGYEGPRYGAPAGSPGLPGSSMEAPRTERRGARLLLVFGALVLAVVITVVLLSR